MDLAVLQQELAALHDEAHELVRDYHDARHLAYPTAEALARPEQLTALPDAAEDTYRRLLRMAHHAPSAELLAHARAAVAELRRQLF
jgi:hypothetical protein